jgi:hypothetical protein
MFDWFVFLVPLGAAPIILLFAFVGCQLIWGVDDYENVQVSLKIASGCDEASSIQYSFASTINDEVYNSELSPVPADGITVSTQDLKLTLADEGTIWCGVTIKPKEGEPFDLPTWGLNKIEGELVEPFTLFCTNGDFELS